MECANWYCPDLRRSWDRRCSEGAAGSLRVHRRLYRDPAMGRSHFLLDERLQWVQQQIKQRATVVLDENEKK